MPTIDQHHKKKIQFDFFPSHKFVALLTAQVCPLKVNVQIDDN